MNENKVNDQQLFPIFTKDFYPSEATTCKRPRSKTSAARKLLSDKTQAFLDFGQKRPGLGSCSCDMLFSAGDLAEIKTHHLSHQPMSFKYSGGRNPKVLLQYPDGSRIILVMPDEEAKMEKLQNILQFINAELGIVEEGFPRYTKIFLHVSGRKVTGVCVAHVISKANRVLTDDEVALCLNSPTRKKRAWSCSEDFVPAKCGINRIWTLASERRKGIATRLLYCIRYHLLMGYALKLEEIAFSDPTPDGRSLAEKFTGTTKFLVYRSSQSLCEKIRST